MVDDGEDSGGIFGLARLCVEHEQELVADFRCLFHVGYRDVQGQEFAQLILSLFTITESKFRAVVSEWQYPLTRAEMHQLDLYDLLLRRWAGDKFKPLPRPWDKKKKSKLTRSQARAILRPHDN